MRSRDPDRPHRSEGATLNPRLLTLPARFRNATTSCSAGRVIINASHPVSPLSAPHLNMSQPSSAPRPRREPSLTGAVNPFVDLISADHLSQQDSSNQSESPVRSGKPEKLSAQTTSGMASVETAATTTTAAPKRPRKLRISLARKAENVAHILRSRSPQMSICPAQRLSREGASQNRQEAQVALTEARRRWECAIEKVRSDVNMAHDVLIPDLTKAVEEAERALLVSTLGGLCLEAARRGRRTLDDSD